MSFTKFRDTFHFTNEDAKQYRNQGQAEETDVGIAEVDAFLI